MNRTKRVAGKTAPRTVRVSKITPATSRNYRPANRVVQKREKTRTGFDSVYKAPVSSVKRIVEEETDDCLEFGVESDSESSHELVQTISVARKTVVVNKPTKTTKLSKDIYQESINLIYQCDPDQKCSKEELIERLEYQRDQLPESTKKHTAVVHVLRELMEEDRTEKMEVMTTTRNKQDQIVKKNKLKKEHFVAKTDLTPDDYKQIGEDEHLSILINSKKLFEKIKEYKQAPKNKPNPFSRGRNRGNRRAPMELMSNIDAKFAS